MECPRRSALPGRRSYALAPLQPLLSPCLHSQPTSAANVSQRRLPIKPSALPPLSVAPRHDVEGFHRAGKGHGKIDVAARNMELEAVGNQRNPDQDQECEG